MQRPTPLASGPFLAALALLALSTPALAQDYTVTRVSGRYTNPPRGALELDLDDFDSAQVALPFEFSYFGTNYDSLFVISDGALQLGRTVPAPEQFFYAKLPLTGRQGGWLGAYWRNLDPSRGGRVLTWTSGDEGRRVFHVGWENVPAGDGRGAATFEVQLHEDSSTIVLAYEPLTNPRDWDFDDEDFCAIALDAPRDADRRFLIPDEHFNGGHPGTDFEIVPNSVQFSGRLVYEKLLTNADGVGTDVAADVPLAGLAAVVLWPEGDVAASAPIADDGSFELVARGLPEEARGSLGVRLENAAVRIVMTVDGPTAVIPSLATLEFDRDVDTGTVRLDTEFDDDGTLRAPVNVARVLHEMHTAISPELTGKIAQVPVVLNGAFITSTRFSPAGFVDSGRIEVVGGPTFGPPPEEELGSPEGLVVKGPTDAWDTDVLALVYARYVLASISSLPSGGGDARFDVETSDDNAFATAFGHWLAATQRNAAIGTFVDGVDGETAATIDVEDPTFEAPVGVAVAGRIAATLLDLLDGGDEDDDTVDGRDDPYRVLRVVETIEGAPTAMNFLDAWANAGLSGADVVRGYIRHEVLPDDAREANDDAAEAVDLGTGGVRVDGLVLNPFNEDWFGFRLDDDVESMIVSVAREPEAPLTAVTVELHHRNGALVGTVSGGGAIVSVTSDSLVAGDYDVRVAHDDGARVADYTLQISRPMALRAPLLEEWTAGRPIERSLGLSGGIDPYTGGLSSGGLPPGIGIDVDRGLVTGQPTQEGDYSFGYLFRDSGRPASGEVVPFDVRINAPLTFELGAYTGFARGVRNEILPPRGGGTSPYAYEVTSGSLPSGIGLTVDDLVIGGFAEGEGRFDYEIRGTDVAGSTHAVASRGVVCFPLDGKKTVVPLLEGDQATGFYVDAVAGSTLAASITTVRRQEKRDLFEPIVVGPGTVQVQGGKRKGKRGKSSVTKLVAPLSGRYFIITGSGDGGVTELSGKLTAKAPTKFSDKLLNVGNGAQIRVEIGALPGAKLDLRAKVGKRARSDGLELRVLALLGPDGVSIALDSETLAFSGPKLRFRRELPVGGTWTVILATNTGVQGEVAWKAKVKQPRRAVFTLPE